MTQNDQIKAHLEQGEELTAIKALALFGSFRLAAGVNDLRKQGMIINSVMVSENGKRFAKYFVKKLQE